MSGKPKFQVENPNIEKAVLVGAQLRGTYPVLSLDESLEELAMLADTAGIEVIGRVKQMLHEIEPSTYVGSGKIQEIIDLLEAEEVKTIIFDDELSPRHQRELNKRLGNEIKVLDRSALILDIFAQHARTKEGYLQVELAQYEYRLPRLTRQWTHLARQAGGAGARGGIGVGLRGPGETQLEVDKREIQQKISKLKTDIEKVRVHRDQYRAQRKKSGIPIIALVGYTNAGKSTLLKAMTDAEIYIADQLFATLDPTTRRIDLPSNRQCLLTDTVGFIQKLPTTLVAAFRATLEEIQDADVILHVVDQSHPHVLSHIDTVEDTLAEIDAPDVPRILVWNKSDKLDNDSSHVQLEEADSYFSEVSLSALKGIGIDTLSEQIELALATRLRKMVLLIPYTEGHLVSALFDQGRVLNQEHTNDGIAITVELPRTLVGRFIDYELD